MFNSFLPKKNSPNEMAEKPLFYKEMLNPK